MLAGHIVDHNVIRLVDAPEPDLSGADDGDIIFQPELACLCGSDLPFFRGEKPSYPLEVGYSLHEMIGTVVATRGRRFRAGDRVLAVPIGQRGFFERYRVSEGRAISIDPRPAPAHAVLAQPLGTVLFGVKKLPPVLGQTVAVVGQGPIGQLFCAVLRNLGAREVIALDRLEERLRISPSMGATAIVDVSRQDPIAEVARLTADRMADVVVEAVGHVDQTLNLCGDLCRHAGRILYFGVPPDTIDGVEWRKLFFKNLTVHTTVDPDFDDDFPLAMRWIAEERIDVSPIVTHEMPLEACQQAFELFRDRRDGALKVFLRFPSAG